MVKYINLRMQPDGQEPFDFLINVNHFLAVDFFGNGFEWDTGSNQSVPFNQDEWGDMEEFQFASLISSLIRNTRISGPATYFVESVPFSIPLEFAAS